MLTRTLPATTDAKVKLITSPIEIDALRPLWDATEREPGADYEFFKLTVQTLANVISPCALTLFRREEPVALVAGRIERGKLPVQFGYISLVDIPIRRVIFIAGGYVGERTEVNWRALLACVNTLLRSEQLDLAVFEHLKVGSFEHEAVCQTFKHSQSGATAPSKHWSFRLPGTWDDFLRTRRQKHRYWLRRLPRVLDRDFSGQWEIKTYSSPQEVMEFVHAADSVAGRTYQRTLNVGFRRDEFTVQRVYMDARRGRLAGYVLFVGGEPRAFWYCFVYRGVLYLAATGYDPAFRSYEPGTILLMKIFQDYCGTEVDTVDFGLGDADYKKRFCSEYSLLSSVVVFSTSSARGRLLQFLHNTTRAGTQIATQFLDRLQMTQRLKTRWRRKLEQQ